MLPGTQAESMCERVQVRVRTWVSVDVWVCECMCVCEEGVRYYVQTAWRADVDTHMLASSTRACEREQRLARKVDKHLH